MKKLAVLLAALLCASPVFAGESGVLKLSLWGTKAIAVPHNTQVITGIDFGIGSAARSVKGVQLDLVFSKTNELKGVQSALLGKAHHVTGVQFNAINLSDGYVTGAQFGFFNSAEELHGVQLGFVNKVNTIKGLQVGLVNIAGNGYLPVMVIVNGRF
ncbi:LA_2272 family surface repeat-containing protein [Candidatus Avelusimicrobium stercoris]|uniref:LA_2272 family surface repeat-containing protein n=1 Tax=Candidatus Avelusimicrobium stercoris TaxID=1947924 RepID=UPI003D0DABAF